MFRFAESTEEFDEMRDRAVAERGIVMPSLREKEVMVVNVPRHDFNGERHIAEAKVWAKENLVGTPTLTGTTATEKR